MSLRMSFIIFVAFCFLIDSISGKAPAQPAAEKCAKQYKLDKATIEKFNKTRPVETKDKNIKCYLKCLLVESKLMSPKGELTLPKFENNKMFAELSHSCKSVPGADPCDKAFNFHKCVVEKKETAHVKEPKPVKAL